MSQPSEPVVDLEPLTNPTKAAAALGEVSVRPSRDKRTLNVLDADEPKTGVFVFIACSVLALAWVGGAAAFFLGYYGFDGLGQGGPERMLGFVFVILGPALILLGLGLVMREVFKFSVTAREIETVSLRLAAPVDSARGEARRLADAIAAEMERMTQSADGALTKIGAMDEVLRHHVEQVDRASGEARGQVEKLIEDLKTDREAIDNVATILSEAATRVSETIDRQAEMVSAATDLAASHATEARELLEKASERLSSAGGSAQQSGEKAAFAISEQMRDMDALVKALDERASRLENLARSQSENLRLAQTTAHELNLAAESGSGAMQNAVNTALDQAQRLSEMVAQEMRSLAKKGADDVETVRAAADTARMAAEEAARSLQVSTTDIAKHVDDISQAADLSNQVESGLSERVEALADVVSTLQEQLTKLPAASGRRGSAGLGRPGAEAPRPDPFDDDFAAERPARAPARRRPPPREPRPEPRAEPARREPRYEPPPEPLLEPRRDIPPERPARARRAEARRPEREPTLLDDPVDPPRQRRRAPQPDARPERASPRGANGAPPRRPEPPRSEPRFERAEPDYDDFDPVPPRRAEPPRRAPSPRRDDRALRDLNLDEPPRARRDPPLDEPLRPVDDPAPDLPDDDEPLAPRRPAAFDERPVRDEPVARRAAPIDAPEPPARSGGGMGWNLKDVLKNAEDGPLDRGGGDLVVAGLRRAGVDPGSALDPDMTDRIARARRRAGSGEARALVIDNATGEVRRTAAALASDHSLRARAEAFVDQHSRLVRRAIDQDDPQQLGALLDTDAGRAYLLIDAALADH